jgi:hypothetical protein
MRYRSFGVIVTPMRQVRLTYLVLVLLLVAGIGGSLLTPFGVNEGVGTFSAGISIGVLIAIYVLRTAQLRSMEAISTAHLNFHGSNTSAKPENHLLAVERNEQPVIDRTPTETPKPATSERASNLLMFDAPVSTDPQPQVPVAEQPEQAKQIQPDKCTCACGCQLKSRGGVIDLCGNCKRWFQQQSVRCTCDSITSDQCTCGAVKHQPIRKITSFTSAA